MTAESASGASSLHPAFSDSISRRLGLAVAAFFLLIVAIGGLSSFLAWFILSSSARIARETHHIEVTEGIHASVHHLIREVDRAVIERAIDGQSHMKDLSNQAASTIAAFLDEHLKEDEPFPEKEKEINLIRVMERLHLQLDTAATGILAGVAAKTRPPPDDLLILDGVAHQIPVLAQQLNEIHHAKIL